MKIAIDLDGTIITAKEKQMSLLRTLGKAHSITIDNDNIWRLKRNGFNNRKSLLTYNFPSQKIDSMCQHWEYLIETFPWLYFDKLIEGAVDALISWKKNGHTLHLLSARTNASHGMLQLYALGIDSLFDTITFVNPKTCEAKVPALKKIMPSYYIGDTEKDYENSILADVIPVLVSSGMRSGEFLSSKTGKSCYPDLASVVKFIQA